MDRRAVWFASTAALCLVAATQAPPTLTERYDLENRTSRVSLPRRLDEASGLAVTGDGRLFMHGDERAVVYQVDPAEGSVVKEFSLGVPVLSGDFEGIAIAGDRFFLINSQGLLLEFLEGAADESVSFRGVDTGLSNRCEVEGMAFEPATQALVAACKTVPRRDEDFIVLYRIGLSDLSVEAEPLRIPLEDLETVGLPSRFAPSGVEVNPEVGTLILVSARQEAILEITGAGQVVSAFHLGSRRHPQAEGISFLPDGTLLLVDERQDGRARLTAYSRGPR